MKSKKINNLQFCTCIFNLFVFTFFGVENFCIFKISQNDILFSIIFSITFTIIFIFIFFKIFNYKKNDDLKNKIISLFNKKIGYIFILLISVIYLLFSIYSFYDLNIFIISQFLSETPILIIEILFSLLIIFLTSKGFSVITKVSNFLFFINIFLFLFFIFGQIKNIELNNFKPILENGFNNSLKGSLYILSFNIIPLFSLLFIPKNNIVKNEKTNKYILITIIISFIIIFLISFLTLGTLGINLINLYQYPTYMSFKRIELFNFLDRIENFIIIQWIFESFISLSYITYFISKMLQIKPYIICTITLLLVNLVFKNTTLFSNIVFDYILYLGLICFILFLIISLKIKKEN